MCTTYKNTVCQVWQNSPNFRAISEPVGTMGSVKTASKFYRVKNAKGKRGESLNVSTNKPPKHTFMHRFYRRAIACQLMKQLTVFASTYNSRRSLN